MKTSLPAALVLLVSADAGTPTTLISGSQRRRAAASLAFLPNFLDNLKLDDYNESTPGREADDSKQLSQGIKPHPPAVPPPLHILRGLPLQELNIERKEEEEAEVVDVLMGGPIYKADSLEKIELPKKIWLEVPEFFVQLPAFDGDMLGEKLRDVGNILDDMLENRLSVRDVGGMLEEKLAEVGDILEDKLINVGEMLKHRLNGVGGKVFEDLRVFWRGKLSREGRLDEMQLDMEQKQLRDANMALARAQNAADAKTCSASSTF